MKTAAIIVLAFGTSCYAQSLAAVQARCARLAEGATVAVGVQQDVIMQALDACRDEAARLTPHPQSKMSVIGNDMATMLAIGQETWAVQRNLQWLQKRQRQKGAGLVEVNTTTELIVTGYMTEGMVERLMRRWKHRRAAKQTMHDAITDAILLPH